MQFCYAFNNLGLLELLFFCGIVLAVYNSFLFERKFYKKFGITVFTIHKFKVKNPNLDFVKETLALRSQLRKEKYSYKVIENIGLAIFVIILATMVMCR